MIVAWVVLIAAILLAVYTYAAYPLLLAVLGRLRRNRERPVAMEWPRISISIPMFNEEAEARDLLDSILALDYPADRRQIVVVSDASTDGTDAIVREYADRGVELIRMEERGGKTRAENAAAQHLNGDIVVNTDASIRIRPDALKPLIAAFTDPGVGVASGRDISVTRVSDERNAGESGYVGYEMKVRALETRLDGIVGASGCFYAIRRELHLQPLPEGLSRDFASALVAREHGYRAVSVNEATCLVPRTPSLHREFRRKVRTVTRGMQTLWHKRHLMNPVRHPVFGWMLFSHKVCRWALPWAAVAAFVALGVLATDGPLALAGFVAGWGVLGLAWLGWRWPDGRPLPRILAVPAFLVASNVALLAATVRAARGVQNAVWEPTRRKAEGQEPRAAGTAG